LSSEPIGLPAGARATGVRLLASGSEALLPALLEGARSAGHAAGLEQGRMLTERALEELERRLAAREESARAELARSAVELALEIARVLLRREIGRGQYDLERIVRDTLSEAAVGRSPCVVHLNPADCARLSEVRFRSGTKIAPDEGVALGDVHVETPLGLLVRDLDGALESIGRRLREELA
jgi:flagellar biosynthesis/type III secretory pathway protein FliH